MNLHGGEKVRFWPHLFSFLLTNKCESCKGSTILSLSSLSGALNTSVPLPPSKNLRNVKVALGGPG